MDHDHDHAEEQIFRQQYIQEQRENAEQEAADAHAKYNRRLDETAPPPYRDPLTRYREDSAREDRRQRLRERVRERIRQGSMVTRAQEMVDLERRLRHEFERQLADQRAFMNYVFDEVVAPALTTISDKLSQQDTEVQRGFKDLFARLAALALELRQSPRPPQSEARPRMVDLN